MYIYQRWVYPVDKSRVNEFGFGGEDDQSSGEVIAAKEEEKKTTTWPRGQLCVSSSQFWMKDLYRKQKEIDNIVNMVTQFTVKPIFIG